MNRVIFLLSITLVCILDTQAQYSSASCTQTVNSTSSAAITFTNGTYCFTSGTYTGNVSNLNKDVIIYVAPGASFHPGNISGDISATIRVYGSCILPTFNVGNQLVIETAGYTNFSGSINFNGNNVKINTLAGGYTIFQNSFQLDRAAAINNAGNMQFNADLNTKEGTMLYSTGTIRLNGSFSPSGAVLNQGLLVAQNVININPNAHVTNTCKMVSVRGFSNNGYFKNEGLVWVTSANEGESHIQNNSRAILETGSNSLMRGMQFTNSGEVSGSGKFYFTTTTRQQGVFNGISGSSITFYDASSTGQIFDEPQSNQHYSYTIRQSFVPKDTTSFDCSATILPVQIISFEVSILNEEWVAITWKTQNEQNLGKFLIERSTTPSGTWTAMGYRAAILNNSGSSYQVVDKTPLPGINYYRLRAVDIDGKEKVSEVKRVIITPKYKSLVVYPTFLRRGETVSVFTEAKGSYQLISAEGKVVMQGSIGSGETRLTINVAPGIYTLKVTEQGKAVIATKLLAS